MVDGPFTEAKELVVGYWLWQVKSMDEAIEWPRRCPNPTGENSVIELREVSRPRTSARPTHRRSPSKERRIRTMVEGQQG